MLNYIDEKTKADKIRNAIAKVVEAGKVKTYDMMKLRVSPGAYSKYGACTTGSK
jgi:3-isopropylmalate dehydrogenase